MVSKAYISFSLHGIMQGPLSESDCSSFISEMPLTSLIQAYYITLQYTFLRRFVCYTIMSIMWTPLIDKAKITCS